MVWIKKEAKAVYLWTQKIRPLKEPKECVIYKIKAVDGWRIYIWTHWANYNWNRNAPYSRYISVDGWPETLYAWTWWTRITLTWYTDNQIYTVKIRPSVVDYGWARACWWRNSWVQDTVLMEIVYDWSYIWYAASATDTWDYFRYYQYIKCTYITQAPEEYLPDTVTTIWQYFRACQYYQCTSLAYSPVECMPNSLTSIWDYGRYQQYYYCSNLTTILWLKNLNISSNTYRQDQYWSTQIRQWAAKVIWDIWAATSNSSYLNNLWFVRVENQYLDNYKNATTHPRSWVTDNCFYGYTTRPWES